jgi:YedE family putative selenium metabolism protein
MKTGVREFFTSRWLIIITGLVLGTLAAFLVFWGDPGNTGFAPTCFLRDISGALGLHQHIGFQYIRPVIIGLVLGSFITAYIFGEFKPRGGSSPLVRFFLAMLLMVGALTFLGCPTRVILRLAGGDYGAIAGVAGLALGIFIGVLFLKRGFDLSRASPQSAIAGWIMPVSMVGLLLALIFHPSFIAFSTVGFGTFHAPIILALGAGLIVGGLAQRSRICFMGAWRDIFIIKNTYLMTGVASAFLAALVFNIILGQFHPGLVISQNVPQPMSQPDLYWDFGGMVLVGLAACFLGACPMRQIVLSGTGDIDAGITVLGMIVGAALVRNLGASSCGGSLAWPYGPEAVVLGLAICIAFGFMMKLKKE